MSSGRGLASTRCRTTLQVIVPNGLETFRCRAKEQIPKEDTAMSEQHLPPAEMIGTRIHTLTSRFYDVEDQIFVFLPLRYGEQPRTRYPVLYVTDGTFLFGPASSALLLYSFERR